MNAAAVPARRLPRRRPRLVPLLRGLAILAVTAVVVFPIYWMLVNAIEPSGCALQAPPALVPCGWQWSNFADLFAQKPIVRWLALSTYVAVLTVTMTMLIVIPAAYAMSRLRWRGRGLLGLLLLFTQMMPGAMVVAPELQLYRELGLTQNLSALALVHMAFAVPLCTWVLKSSFDAVPHELIDAALIDGCGPLAAMLRILLPLTRPGLVAVGVIAFFSSWNDYLFSSALVTEDELFTGSLGLATLITQLDTPIFVLMAAGVMFSVLPVLFYIAIQRHILAGLTAGAVKG